MPAKAFPRNAEKLWEKCGKEIVRHQLLVSATNSVLANLRFFFN